ncbi:hypothetical protein [uncultured Porphyromonas sp.]|uniref:hypothetical protein n=1 Tax=uncultured Porphyromonas sp. TaxID=159274 RepID=UPI0025931F3F|nr:hypothetical protein [uncultured Porphyromonas sp.]
MTSISKWSLTLLLGMTLGLASCGNDSNKSKEQTSAEEVTPAALEVDQVLADPDSLVGDTIEIEGICTHICKHGGGKIFLMGSDDTKTLRVEAGESIGSFPQETVNSIVRVTGVLVEDRIDEDYLAQWEAQIADQAKETQGEGGCAADMKANAEAEANSVRERIANFRSRIAERTEREGKPYVSLYHMEGLSYEIR